MAAREQPRVLKLLEQEYGDLESHKGLAEGDLLTRLILLMLARGSRVAQAQQVLEKLQAEFVDWNELRVTPAWDVRKHLTPLDRTVQASAARADQIRQMLATVFNRFNKLTLEFLREGHNEPDAPRKREKFLDWLEDHHPALRVMIQSYGSGRIDPAAHAEIQRVVQRLGWTRGKSGSVAARAALSAHGAGIAPLAVQWRIAHLAADCCHARAPQCERCPVNQDCPLGRKVARPAKPAARKPAARIRK